MKNIVPKLILAAALSVGLLSQAGAQQVCQDLLTRGADQPQLGRYLPHLDPHSAQQWKLATQLLGKSLSEHISQNFSTLRLIKESSILPSLERAGFLNHYGGLPDDSQLFESTIQLMNYFSVKKEAALRLGKITEGQSIEPGFIFSDPKGENLIALPFGAKVPQGYFLSLNNPDLIDGKIFTDFLGAGYQVVQVSVDRQQDWMSFHDIAHLFGYYQELSYMKTVRSIAQNPAAPSGAVFNFHRMANFYIFEIFSWVNPKALREFEKVFGLEELANCRDTDCIRNLIYENGQARPDILEYLRKDFNHLIRPLGGSLLSQNSVLFMGESGSSSAPFNIAQRWLGGRHADLFVEFLYQMNRTDIASHAEVLRRGPSLEFCSFYYQFALHSKVWERLCPTHF